MRKLLTGKTFLFLSCLVFALLTNWILGVHFGEASENYWVSRWVQGYPKGNAILNMELFLYGISYPIHRLSFLNHDFNFLALFLWIANLVASFLVIETISYRLKHVRNYIFAAFFFILLFAENFVFIDLTRSAVSLSFAGILFGLYSQGKNSRVLIAVCFITLGLCIRPAVAYLGLVFLFLTALSQYFNGTNLWTIRHRLLPILLVFILFIGIQNSTKSEDFSSVNKRRSQVYDRGYDIANEGQLNALDLAVFSSGFVGFEQLKPFYKKLSLSLSYDTMWLKLNNSALGTLDYYPYLFVMLILIMFSLKKRMYVILGLWLGSLIMLSVCYKLPNRVFYPYAGMFLVTMLMVSEKHSLKGIWVKGAIFLVLGMTLGKLGLRSKYTLELQRQNDEVYYSLIDESKGRYLFVSGLQKFTLYLNPFKNYGEKALKGLTGLRGWPTLLPAYTENLHYSLGSNSFSEIFTNNRNLDNSLFLLDDACVELLSSYIQKNEGETIEFTKERSLDKIKMSLYRLKK